MLPHVAAQDRIPPRHDRGVLVGRAVDREGAPLVHDEPAPPAPESSDARLGELLLELVEATERLGERRGEPALRRLRPTGSHHFPEGGVIGVSAAVVADRSSNRLGQGLQVGQQLLDGLLLQIGMLLQRGVEIIDVGSVVLVVMKPHRLLVDVRLQSLVVVRERGKGECHDRLLSRKLQYSE